MGADKEHGTHDDHVHELFPRFKLPDRMYNDELSATGRAFGLLQKNADRLSSLPDVIGSSLPVSPA